MPRVNQYTHFMAYVPVCYTNWTDAGPNALKNAAGECQ
jgi:hypothetical protein